MELNSLNVRWIEFPRDASKEAGPKLDISNIPVFWPHTLGKLVFEDAEVVSECALIFTSKEGEEIVIATGIPPGSVSVSAPFSDEVFEPEFSRQKCRYESL